MEEARNGTCKHLNALTTILTHCREQNILLNRSWMPKMQPSGTISCASRLHASLLLINLMPLAVSCGPNAPTAQTCKVQPELEWQCIDSAVRRSKESGLMSYTLTKHNDALCKLLRISPPSKFDPQRTEIQLVCIKNQVLNPRHSEKSAICRETEPHLADRPLEFSRHCLGRSHSVDLASLDSSSSETLNRSAMIGPITNMKQQLNHY